jgi:hypothetical protein
VTTRVQQGQSLPAGFAGELIARVAEAKANWREVMRYRRSIPAAAEADLLNGIAEWFMENHLAMWR